MSRTGLADRPSSEVSREARTDADPATDVVEYSLRLDSGKEYRFLVQLERASEGRDPGNNRPEWTRLGYKKCANCPLATESGDHCPPAVDSLEILKAFEDTISHESCHAVVRTADRDYSKRCSVQTALRSLLGLVMATSGCPVLGQLKGMAANHLPFATLRETVYRTTANHLLKQFFVHKRGGTPDLELIELRHLYREIQVVNEAFLKRIRAAATKDASLNALLNLLSVATLVGFSLDEGLKGLKALFED